MQHARFGILGYGFVGKATHYSLLQNQETTIHDVQLGTSLSALYDAETIFICLPTADQDDIDNLITEIGKIKSKNPFCQFILRSTVPVGTCRLIQERLEIKLIYIPEFLRQRFWQSDCQRRPIIVGSEKAELPIWLELEEKIRCSLEEAELIKMFANNFASIRIAFANLFYDLSQHVGADYNVIKDAFFQVEPNQTYLEVPGHDGTRGFGGKCLPKDLDFLLDTLDKNNIDNSWLKNIKDLNKEWLKKF